MRDEFALDETGERRLALIEHTARRYEEARQLLDAEGLVRADGRPHPAIAVERDSRAALARLLNDLGLEDSDETTKTVSAADARAFPAGRG